MKAQDIQLEDLYRLELKTWWTYFKSESFAFKMICLYLFTEYVRPQSIWPWLDFLPWAQLFVIGALLGLLADPKKKWVKSPVNKWMVLFFISILWSTYHAHYPDWSYRNLANFYSWFVIYFLIINIVTTQQRLLCFLAIFCVASFKISFSVTLIWAQRGFAFTSWGLKGPPGFFEDSGELAIQMAVFWPISLAVALNLKPYLPIWKQRVLILMPVTSGMVILGASSRGGQLAALAQFVMRFAKQVFNLKVLVSVLLVGLLAWSFLPSEQKQRFDDAGSDTTSKIRLLYWEHGFEMLNDHPFTGVGYFNFIPYYADNYLPYVPFPNNELAHNIFVQVGADLGYTGLVIYIATIFSGLLLVRRIKMRSKGLSQYPIFKIVSVFNVSFVGFLIAGQFVSVVYYPFMWIHLAFCSVAYSLFHSDVRSRQ
ncbi:hypothetical protein A3742_02250 [Oleiphilus sp. HI0071]|uniref:O-antigen ligase family protein n=1 Tax=Oleiphilus sp. HI0080 TaxID=1822255 RepID=UPI0007C27C95|nr:O-antigen ligase family protein [Oleiphilus sp. HI0080]KZY61022.1 hypothetical protein A3737_06040 [Oleiphilus sp. HI0065]KZY79693.1 hypothetical protein A3742_02250 [Oleiphilus sp. HI0071]KZY89764.1 hypothetical protein A3744_06330 [Oleiphilus sp. HI0073]KZZ55799.1 hypothetical protein A3760_00360 [Oleiphilus sp. HI0122]KZZ00995.1 hypothetical protein A3744_28770 [Oleiphilus sp. HI0073]